MIKRLLTRRNLLIAGLALFLGGLLIAPKVQSSGPQFNYMPGDHELLVMANSTQGTDWSDPLSANPGDKIAFQIYYHNGVENTVARNTRIRVDLPSEAGAQLVSQAYLWADNASMITDTGVLNINGRAQTLSYVPGTTKWYPNRSQTPTSLPDGIVTANGVNIGNITGCWPYAGFVVFQATLESEPTPAPEPNLIQSKSAYNITRNIDATSIINRPNDLIEYKLMVRNIGDGPGTIQIKDNISSVLKYGVMVNRYNGNLSDGVISWPKITVQPGKSVTKRFRIRIKEAIPANQTVYLTNIYGNRVKVPARRDLQFHPGLAIIKTVRNLSRGQTTFVKQNSGSPGDILEYRLKVINEGDVELKNVKVKDILPQNISYQAGSARYGYGPTEINNPLNDNLVGTGVNLGNLVHQGQTESQYQWLRIQFRTKIKSLEPGSYFLKNRVVASALYRTEISSGTLSDQAWAATKVRVYGQPALTINKKVKNLTRLTGWQKKISAYAGEKAAYQIIIKNTGQTTINDLRIIDILPANTYFNSGTARLIYRGSSSHLSNNLVKQYINLPSLKKNEELKITFTVRTNSNLAKGSVLVNIAQARGAGLSERSTANIKIISRPAVEGVEGPLTKSGASLGWPLALFGIIGAGYWLYCLKLLR